MIQLSKTLQKIFIYSLFSYLFVCQICSANESDFSIPISSPEQIIALTEHADNLIGGIVSPLAGLPSFHEVDLVAKGAQNLVSSRIYIPHYMPCHFHENVDHDENLLLQYISKHYQGWVTFPHKEIQTAAHHARITTPSGATLQYFISPQKCELKSSKKGMSNLSNDQVSAENDLRNIKVSLSADSDHIIVAYPNGLICHYTRMTIAGRKSGTYLITKEVLPNGKIIKYFFENKRMVRAQSMDGKERHTYASIDIQYSDDKSTVQYRSNTGQVATYKYESQKREKKYKYKVDKVKRECSYSLMTKPVLTSVNSPFYQTTSMTNCSRFFLGHFQGKDDNFNLLFGGFGGQNSRHYRVLSLAKPQSDGLYESVAELDYTLPNETDKQHLTRVRHGDGTLTIYQFNEDLLPTSVKNCNSDDSIRREKLYFWDSNKRLQSLEIKDGSANVLLKKSYEYDNFGNPIIEHTIGDLCGEGLQDVHTIKRQFSQDGYNLLLREDDAEGLTYTYKYHLKTNLVTEKLSWANGQVIKREFYDYDDCDNLICAIIDDGITEDRFNLSKITQRKIKRYKLRQHQPFLHMVESIDELYLDQGSEKLLKRSAFEYDQWGNVSTTHFYDAENQLTYSIKKEYNERGDLLSETNSIGKKAHYAYDARGFNTVATSFSGNLRTERQFDPRGRILQKNEIGIDGEKHAFGYQYDVADRVINAFDAFGNKTNYRYDLVVNKPTYIEEPGITTKSGTLSPVINSASYNSLGYKISSTDPKGNITRTKYNAIGMATEIVHPDGTKEYSRYTKKGLLRCHTDQEGVLTIYSYDQLGRILSKYCLAADGTQFGNQTYTYNSFHLLSETDSSGKAIYYFYDGAGRKIREECSGKITSYSYDSLSRLSETVKNDGFQELHVRNEYDLLNRIVNTTKSDAFGTLLYKISYEYDAESNKSAVIRNIDGRPSRESFIYDSFNRLIQSTDGSENETMVKYNENFINKSGQRVLQTSIWNPDGVLTVKTDDSIGNLARKEIFNKGVLISSVDYFYDSCSNLVEQQDHDYKNGQLHQTQTVQYQHNNNNKIVRMIRAAGTQESRTTSCTYTPSGKLATKTLPDLTTLAYSYTPECFLKRLSSTDGRLSHHFEYNINGKLLKATDEFQNVVIERELDQFDNVLNEKFSTALQIEKSYDLFDRAISIRAPQIGQLTYVYDPLHLKSITRSNNGQKLYQHRYTSYDLNGNLLKEELPSNLGTIEHFYTPTGRVKNILGPYFAEQYDYDSCQRLIQKASPNDGIWNYAYDPLSQLTGESNNAIDQLYEYEYDALCNCIQKNGQEVKHNDLNEMLTQGEITCKYDVNGNLIEKESPKGLFKFAYDPLNRLIDAISPECRIHFAYDPLGRRLSKTVEQQSPDGSWTQTLHENYLYDGMEEIGALNVNGSLKQFRVLGNAVVAGMAATVAIELGDEKFVACCDPQGNIRQLVDMSSKKIAANYQFTGFGEVVVAQGPKAKLNPWSYANKRSDDELGLIYFGHRYYDSELARWLSPDPEGFHDSMNLYQFLLNNPYSYVDPDGKFVIAIPLLVWGAEMAWATYTAYTVATIAASVAVYEGVKAVNVAMDKRQRFKPDDNATGDHSRFRKNKKSNKTDYESYRKQTNPKDPKKWETTKRFDNDHGDGNGSHHNKKTKQDVPEPHVHDPNCPGGVRSPELWEIPK